MGGRQVCSIGGEGWETFVVFVFDDPIVALHPDLKSYHNAEKGGVTLKLTRRVLRSYSIVPTWQISYHSMLKGRYYGSRLYGLDHRVGHFRPPKTIAEVASHSILLVLKHFGLGRQAHRVADPMIEAVCTLVDMLEKRRRWGCFQNPQPGGRSYMYPTFGRHHITIC